MGPPAAETILERDGWAPYRRFTAARHQSCLAHLLRRCSGMIEDSERGQARVPHALRRILGDALQARERHEQGAITRRGLHRIARRLERRIERLLAGKVCYPPNVRLLRHLANEAPHLFTFLKAEGVEATNWRAEQALRPAVVARKHWGGNASWQGAHTFEVLASLLRTCRQQKADAITVIVDLLRSPNPGVAPVMPGDAAAPARAA